MYQKCRIKQKKLLSSTCMVNVLFTVLSGVVHYVSWIMNNHLNHLSISDKGG